MIPIPFQLKDKLFELDLCLHELGKSLYGRKLFKEYAEGNYFNNFYLELHGDGSFTLHFIKSILGYMEAKSFGTQENDVLNELDLLIALVRHKLKMVSAQ